MRNYSSSLIIVLLFTTLSTQAQKQTTFYLMPHIGIEWPISKFENKTLNPSNVSGIYVTTSDKWGIALAVDFKNNWNLGLGFERGNVGWGVRFDNDSRSFSESTTVRRGYFNISKPFKLVEIRKKKHAYLDNLLKINKEYAYWAVFDINFLGGLSYGYIPPFNPFSGLSLNGSKNTTSILKINRYGIGAHVGFYFQFYKNNKKRLRLGFTYQQGLRDRMRINWETSIKGVKQPEFQTFTRDSMLAIYAAYPIRLFSIKEKGTIKGS